MSFIPRDRIKRVKWPSGRSRFIRARTNAKMHRPPTLRTLKESPHSKSALLMQWTRLSPRSKVVACFGTVHRLLSPFESFSALPLQ